MHTAGVDSVFLGREAIAAGDLTANDLRRRYTALFRGVYVPRGYQPTLRDRIVGAWLASGRRAVIGGAAASALHGARWVDPDIPIDVIGPHIRPQTGLVVREGVLPASETTTVGPIPVTTPVRTAFDLGRRLPCGPALARLDALKRARPFDIDAVAEMARTHRGVRGLRRLRAVLPLVDGGAASPKETWLRLLLINAGFPTPQTQIPVNRDYYTVAVLDMGWRAYMVAAEYDGDGHRVDRESYRNEHRRREFLEQAGWLTVRVIKEDRPADIVERVATPLIRRGWRPSARFCAFPRPNRTQR